MILFQNLQDWWSQKLLEKGLFSQFLRKWRRLYYGLLRKEQVRRSIEETRQGECHRCGRCCELLFRCPFLGKDGEGLPYCRIYGDLRPSNCHVYPFDRYDSEIAECGFRFKESALREGPSLPFQITSDQRH